ncbi:MAG: heme-binding protein [Desulfobacterales bacterium]
MIIMGATNATAIEEAKYEVVEKDNSYEIRNYEPQVVAEIIVEGDLEEAGKIAFKRLFRYISGDNQSRAKISMTAPVSLETASEKIKMTAPVKQQRSQGKWAVSFMMPASYTLDSLPIPDDPDIKLRKISARRVAAVQYSGFWSEKSYLQHKSELEGWIDKSGFIVTGEAIWARYNSPFTPWFLRRNEVLIPVETATNNVNFK